MSPKLVPALSDRGCRGVCVGQNLYKGTFTMEGGEISGNGGPGVGTALPPGGGVYVSSKVSSLILKGAVNIKPDDPDDPDNTGNTVCLTSASSGECPFITLGQGFTASNPKITLDLAATRPEWVIKWLGKKVLPCSHLLLLIHLLHIGRHYRRERVYQIMKNKVVNV